MPEPCLRLEDLGWDADWRASASAYADVGAAGRVTRVDRGLCSALTPTGLVRASFGGSVLEAMVDDPRAAPCTGDWCVLRQWPDGPVTVEAVLPRRTALVRAEASGISRGQVLATNVDVVAVVIALHPDPNLGRVERLLSLAWQSGATPVVVLTKADVVSDGLEVASDVRGLAAGVSVLCTSTETGAGIDVLRRRLRGSSVVLVGASGHGKSSLANALVGADALLTRRIRDDGKGRHTSVRRELIPLPGGGAVIDTPGLRGVGLPDSADGLAAAFPDIASLSAHCRFDDCAHAREPGCAVIAAAEIGALSVRRLDSWRRLHSEQQQMALRSDARLRSELHKRLRRESKQLRTSNSHKHRP
ncbi:MAG: ribosome small subunit-dependent GTPase A [Nocardioidaceae bacterium]